ncbi:MAG: cell division protein FtsA [Kiritimatiellia bacterium]
MNIPPLVGIEIGTSKVVAVVGEVKPDGSLLITGMGREDSKGVRKGEIVDFDTVLACVKSVLVRAEENAQVEIGSVLLAFSGGHLQSLVNQGSKKITGPNREITEEDEAEVMSLARSLSLPPDREVVHSIGQHFIIDDERVVHRAAGMEGSRLSLEMLIVHGSRNRLTTPVRLVRTIPVELEDTVFGGLCSALAVLTPEQKEDGVLVIDLGGGTTDYVLYASSKIAAMGALAVGGDHVTNDIASAFAIQTKQAERIKREHGSAVIDVANRMKMVNVPADMSFEARSFATGSLHTVINARIDETFQFILKRLNGENLPQLKAGVVLTGGGAKLRGVREHAEKVFRLPCSIGKLRGVSGAVTQVADPEYATVVGLVKFGHKTARQVSPGFWSQFGERFSKWLRSSRASEAGGDE